MENTRTRKLKPGIYEQHSRNCRSVVRKNGRCDCDVSYQVRKMTHGKMTIRTVQRLQDAEGLLADWDLRERQGLRPSLEQTFSSYLDEFTQQLEDGNARTGKGALYKPRSRHAYLESLRVIRRHGFREFDKQVDVITRRDMQRVVDVLAEGVRLNTVHARLAPMRAVWLRICREAEIRNPMDGLLLPRDSIAQARITPQPVDAFILAKELEPRERIFCMFGLLLGMRAGEVLALRWRHIELEKRVVSIRHGWSQGVYTTPKSPSAVRDLEYGVQLQAELDRYRGWIQSESGEAFLNTDALVVSHPGDPLGKADSRTLYSRIDRFVGLEQGKQLRLHGLRRAHTTALIREGVPIHTIKEIVGHARVRTTLDVYAQVQRQDRSLAADRMDNALIVATNLVDRPEAEIQAWTLWQETLDEQNEQLSAAAEVQGGGFVPRVSPLFDL